MPRTLAFAITSLWLLVLAGCTAPTPKPAIVSEAAPIVRNRPSAVLAWLNQLARVSGLPIEQVKIELEGMERPEGGPELFYFGLLNQHSQDYEGWIQARDAFRNLHTNQALAPEQRQLVGILEVYNQQRINWYQQYLQLQADSSELQRQLEEADMEKEQLRQKIQALTELEAQISTRKDQ